MKRKPSTSTQLAVRETIPGFPAMERPDVLGAFLQGRNPRTLRAYAKDLDDFAKATGHTNANDALAAFLALSQGDANAAALAYRAQMVVRGLKTATISRRLSALRSIVKVARQLGRVAWKIDVDGPKAEPYRDTSGPGVDGWERLRRRAKLDAESGKAKAVRDLAIVRLLHSMGLRRGEVLALDLADVDLAACNLAVVGKGKTEPKKLTMSDVIRDALAHWIELRGSDPGPLFVSLDRARYKQRRTGAEASRLTGEAIRKIVKRLSKSAGIPETRPHGLRHRGITDVAHNQGFLHAQAFARHANPRVTQRYIDNDRDLYGEAVKRLCGQD
jgi:integrase/recombinase XerC